MQHGTLEHVNLTVSDPDRTAEMLCNLFDWRVRWRGKSALGGDTVHVGTDDSYLAVYTGTPPEALGVSTGKIKGGLNHVGVVVSDLALTEGRVKAEGFTPHNHGDYEPGRRFYFHDSDGIEFEVVSYT